MRLLTEITLLFFLTSSTALASSNDLYQLEDTISEFNNLIDFLSPSSDEKTCNTLDQYDFRQVRRQKEDNKILPWCDKNRLCSPLKKSKAPFPYYESDSGRKIYTDVAYHAQGTILGCQLSKQLGKQTLNGPIINDEQLLVWFAVSDKLQVLFNEAMNNGREPDFKKLMDIFNKADEKNTIPQKLKEELVNFQIDMLKWRDQYPTRAGKILPKLKTIEGLSLIDTPASLSGVRLPESEIKKLNREYEIRMHEGSTLFDELKRDFYDLLKRELELGKINKKQFDSTWMRIKTIKLSSYGDSMPTSCILPNASYSSVDHEIKVCPQILAAPHETLAMVIAHEIGHSFDPCIASKKFMAVNKDSGYSSAFSSKNNNMLIPGMEADKGIYSYPSKMTDDAYDYTVDHVGEIANGFSQLTPDEYKTLDHGFNSSNHPFADEIECLESFRSINANVNSDSDVKKLLKSNFTYRSTRNDHQSIIAAKLYEKESKDPTRVGYWNHCSLNNNSEPQTGEAFADYISAQIMAKRVKKYPPAKQREKSYEAAGFIISSFCGGKSSLTDYDKINELLKKHGCSEVRENSPSFWSKIEGLFKVDDPHPDSDDRLQDIFLANPTIAKALGCKQSGKYCGE